MIKLSIPQSEINKAVKEMEGRASTYERNVAKELFKGALDIESGAKQRAPVITNTLLEAPVSICK